MKKLIQIGLFLVLSLTSLMAEDSGGILGSLQGEASGGIAVMKQVIILMILLVFFMSPIGGYFLGTKIAKSSLKNEQSEDNGYKIYMWGAFGVVAGLFIGYFAVGWFGSMLDPSMGGEINYAKGTNYVISRLGVLGS